MRHSYSGYVGGCRCDRCRAASAAYASRRRRAIQRPDEAWTGLIPAGPVRARLVELLAAGHTAASISRAVGVAAPTVRDVVEGRRRKLTRRVHDQLMALIPGGEAGSATRSPQTLREDAEDLDSFFGEMADILEERREPWRRRAACKGQGVAVAVFFPPRGASTAPARQLCAGCPVIREAERYGITVSESARSCRFTRPRS